MALPVVLIGGAAASRPAVADLIACLWPPARNSQHNGFGEDQLGVRCAAVLMSAWGQTRSLP
jgi:hypothetical protein